ncbi:uncharacterized protein METZ01_LOCUS203827 [marine metagenome]|uniref:Uncharacterized protein n=1 Tax=marine metagenome TaxID=408172 RepID=A0A382EM56_9ZZZZ
MGTGYEVEVDSKGRYVVRNSSTGARHGRFGMQRQAKSLIGALPDVEAPVKKPARARKADGKLKADDPSTPDVNEAWEGGKAPKKKKRKAPAKKKAKK